MKHIFLLVFLISAIISVNAQERYSKVKIYVPADRSARAQLLGLLEIDHFDTWKDGSIIAEISQSDINLLKATPYRYDVLVPDITEHLIEVNKKYYSSLDKNGVPQGRVAIEQPGSLLNNVIVAPAAFQVMPGFGGYYTFSEMESAMDVLVATYPAIAQKIDIGTTSNGNDIWVIKISDNVATDEANEPEILYMGLQHAREAITGASMIFFMQYLCERYALDTRIQNLVDNREFYIIPCLNPDGWEWNNSSMGGNPGGGWRKNRRWTGGAASNIGVDLNRNWGVDWANCSAPILGAPSSCGSASQTADTYWGTSVFSEAETQAVRNFTKAHHIVSGIDQHAFGPYYSLPFGRKSLHPGAMSLKGINYFTAVPALMGKYNGMRAADSYDALGYEVAGGFKDWMLMGELGTSIGSGLKDSVWALTGEGGAGGGTGGAFGSFWAPAGEIVNLCKGMTYQNLQVAFAAGTYVDIQDLTDIALPSLTGNLSFSIQRLGLRNDPVTVTLVPLENIQSVGAPVTINSMPNYYDTAMRSISYTLPATLLSGQRIKFAWRVSAGGYIYSDTVVKFYNPTQLLYDDMQGVFATNWINTAASAPVASGFGYNYIAGNWDFTASGGYGSTKALSESAAGTNYPTRAQRIAQYNGTFNLTTATAAYLTFWTRHRAENFRDKLQVQVSTNGTTWVSIPGSTTVQEPGILDDASINGEHALTGIRDYWTKEVFNLSAYNGTPALRLRFRFTADDDPSGFLFDLDDGFYIDNVKVIMTSTALFILPVKFIAVTGRVTQEKNIQVDWQAEIDQNHRYFEVEKSTDQQTFIPIGRVNGASPYSLIDRSPSTGNNYYRIKAIDANGQATYSKIINVIYNYNLITVSMYPNPVKDDVNIKINTMSPGRITLQISDISGNLVYEKHEMTDVTTQNLKVDVRKWASQVYILKIKNANGETLSIQKFIKQ